MASELRAEGAETAEQIRADADRQRTIILAEAYRDAEITRGEGDAKAAETYAGAYNKGPGVLFLLPCSINAYRNSFGNGGDLLVLDSESDFFRYLKRVGKQGIAPAFRHTPGARASRPRPRKPMPDASTSARGVVLIGAQWGDEGKGKVWWTCLRAAATPSFAFRAATTPGTRSFTAVRRWCCTCCPAES